MWNFQCHSVKIKISTRKPAPTSISKSIQDFRIYFLFQFQNIKNSFQYNIRLIIMQSHLSRQPTKIVIPSSILRSEWKRNTCTIKSWKYSLLRKEFSFSVISFTTAHWVSRNRNYAFSNKVKTFGKLVLNLPLRMEWIFSDPLLLHSFPKSKCQSFLIKVS